MRKPKVCVLRTAGTNCDQETAFAFVRVGAQAELVHVNRLLKRQVLLAEYQILALPGGFTYGDDIAAGKILANELRYKLIDDLKSFIASGKLIIGICNGFQILVKAGLLPGNAELKQEVSLIINDSGKFEDRWVYLRNTQYASFGDTQDASRAQSRDAIRNTKCVWVGELPEIIYLPVAHGEGKFIVQDKAVLARLKKNGQIVFQYCDEKGGFSDYPDNPNGSEENIAGICDISGRILGLMPHPERHIAASQHPRWRGNAQGDGLQIFRNGVEYARKYLSKEIK